MLYYKRLLPSITILVLLFCANRAHAISAAESRQLIQYRQLGHQFLLAVGDSTSRVTVDGSYRISFEKPFSFIPDSLASVVSRLMAKSILDARYVLTVMREGSQEVVYGFTGEDVIKNTVPCIGRMMPADRYVIIIQRTAGEANGYYYASEISALLLGASVAGGIRFYRRRKRNGSPSDPAGIAIGGYTYLPSKGLLSFGQESMPLTGKEQTLLSIFTRQLNQVIDRNALLKEGWEDEGVITGRSLDMYVSKLRKKLEKDASVGIKNVHGKGYMLSVEASS